ncbi:NYN domain-containing protein [Rubrivivax sp. RP6-9]|uniref:NYN domain-containing protein n=1 Tax=Rubrivivax sp. RP6-9 TaxID=3415750 RepID=UPI003CC66DFF
MSTGTTSGDRVMLLIDADNVSVDVMEQTVQHLLAEHGALHVRRAYCTAESAVANQAVFKRLGIKPMVNLATGKNSTDIALAVDALDLVLAERPEVVAIASSDSDFAPLVARLREKGCRVVGYGQDGKTGDETQAVYDAYTVFAHRKSAARTAAEKPARSAAGKATRTPAAKKASTRRKTTAAPAPEAVQAPPPPPPPPAPPPLPDKVRQILAALPELLRGETVELRVAAERLRDADLLGPKASSTKLFAPFADRFELLPEQGPNKVRLRQAP